MDIKANDYLETNKVIDHNTENILAFLIQLNDNCKTDCTLTVLQLLKVQHLTLSNYKTV